MANYLSGGEQQMLAIARALMSNPKVLIMDEPSEGLAPLVVNQITEIVSQLKPSMTVLLAEQNINMALKLADYIYIISQGSMVYESTPEELRENEKVKHLYLGVNADSANGGYKVKKQDEKQAPHPNFLERMGRMQATVTLQQADQIPIVLPAGYYLAEVGGITKQELLENQDKAQELKEKVALELQPDAIAGVFPTDSRPYLGLGDRMTRFPGHGLGENTEFQFVESEFMKADEYDAFLADPVDWAIRKYLPRAYENLGGMAMIPSPGMLLGGSYSLLSLSGYTIPPVMASLQTFYNAIQEAADVVARSVANTKRMISLGFIPAFMNSAIAPLAPFDFMANTLRGMRGIMMDIFRQPEKLLAAEQVVSKIQLESAIATSKALGLSSCVFFLHRGSDGFMSLQQFEKFYWPQLKNMMEVLIENGITPYAFYEGVWDDRLDYLVELPKGKTVGLFQNTDIFKAKEILGDTMCIAGGMPVSLLKVGTRQQVRARTKEVCERVGKGGGFIMCTNVGEMSGSKPELVERMGRRHTRVRKVWICLKPMYVSLSYFFKTQYKRRVIYYDE